MPIEDPRALTCCLCGAPVSEHAAQFNRITWQGTQQPVCSVANCPSYTALAAWRHDVAAGLRGEWLGVLEQLERAAIVPHRNRVEGRTVEWDWTWERGQAE